MNTFFATANPFGPTVPPRGVGYSSFRAAQPRGSLPVVHFGQTDIEKNINKAAKKAEHQAKHSAKTFQQFLKDLKPKPYWADELRYGAAVVLREVIPSALDFSYHLPFAGLLFSVVGWIPGKITPLIADFIAPQGPPVLRGYTLQELHEWQRRGWIDQSVKLPSLERALNREDLALLNNAKLNQRLTELINNKRIRAQRLVTTPGGMTVLRGYSLKELYEFENDFKKFNIKLPKADKALTAEEMNELYNNEVLMKKLNELAEKHKIRPAGVRNYSFIRRLERLMQSYRVLDESIEQLAEHAANNPKDALSPETNLVIKRFMNELQQFIKSIFKPTLGLSISLDHKKGVGKFLMKGLQVRAVYNRGFAGNSKMSRFITRVTNKFSQFEKRAKFLRFILWPVKAILSLVKGGGMLWNRSKILKILAG